MGLIYNCDLGEHESDAQTSRLMSVIDAANIGCGVHAGSAAKTCATIKLARELGIKIGAHPGVPGEGGRGQVQLNPHEFRDLLDEQVGGFFTVANSLGASVHHLKLHGSLYHAVEVDAGLRRVLIRWLLAHPGLVLFSLAGGACVAEGRGAGISVYGEVFADRSYQVDRSLVPRSQRGALIGDVAFAAIRLKNWQATGLMRCVDGSLIHLAGETVCVHSDSPQSFEFLAKLRVEMGES